MSQNNQQRRDGEVADRREKILYLEGEPRFEMKFIAPRGRGRREPAAGVPAAARRTSSCVSTWTTRELAGGFPKTREELFRYQGIVLGSVEASFFTADQLLMIADFVSQRGAGCWARRAPRPCRGWLRGTPVAEVLPVVLEAAAGRQAAFFTELKVEPTASG